MMTRRAGDSGSGLVWNKHYILSYIIITPVKQAIAKLCMLNIKRQKNLQSIAW